MNNTVKTFTAACSLAAVCVATGAAMYLKADTNAESGMAPSDQLTMQQLWNFAVANAEGISSRDQWSVYAESDVMAKGH